MVRGLTHYISIKQDLFMEAYEFPHNSVLLIDGNGVAAAIYTQMEGRNSCFGGDYDKYAILVRYFFHAFLRCNVIPYVVFDGVHGPKKADFCNVVLKERIQKTTQLEGLNDDQANLPIFFIDVFKNIVKELSIKMVMCNFDCDRDIASLADKLNCPILSNDSDFFIYNAKYIPFFLNGNERNVYVYRKIDKTGKVNKYLKCMMFNRGNFLKHTRLTLEKLPILTVYLGNNYIENVMQLRKKCPQFCSYLKLRRGNYVTNIIQWLATKNTNEAVQILLNYFKDKSQKEQIKNLIEEVKDEYSFKEISHLKYLQDSDVTQTDSHDDHEPADELLENMPSTFVNRYRRGFYHEYFLDISLFHKYMPKPLVEDLNKDSSHKLCFPIISAIHKILSNNTTENLLFCGRQGADISEQTIPKYKEELPSYEQLQEMKDQIKLHYFLKILHIEEEFMQNCLELFPESWHILLITLKYLSKVTKVEQSLIFSFIMSKIILSYVDKKLGLIRTRNDFDNFVSKREAGTENVRNDFSDCVDVFQAIQQINMPDCLKALENFLPYFELPIEKKNYDILYKINLIHSVSEFQSCLLHVGFLNDLFCSPFKKCLMWEFYNGTFIYNMLCQLQSDQDFISNSLDKSPTILRCFDFILALVKTQII